MPRPSPLVKLLEQRCLCVGGKCYQQFQGLEEQVAKERKRFQDLDALRKASRHLGFVLAFEGGRQGVSLTICDPKEQLLRQWYNVDTTSVFQKDEVEAIHVLQQSDEEESIVGELLLGSGSECEKLSNGPCDAGELLMETSSGSEIPDTAPPEKKRRYSKRSSDKELQFMGKGVCSRAHQRLYAIGAKPLQNLRDNRPAYTMHDNRMQEPKHEDLQTSLVRSSRNSKWPGLVTFFWILYISCAEILPTKFKMPAGSMFEAEVAADPDFQERYTSAFLKNIEKNFERSHPGELGPGTFEGPRRYLEHAQPIDIFHQYVQHVESEGNSPASFSTFMRVFRKMFSKHLAFREKGEHAQCNVCFRYKERIRKAATKKARADLMRGYGQHLLSQWMDRQFYWRVRALSRNFFSATMSLSTSKLQMLDASTSYLTVIMDGMDQSKLRVPKMGYARLTKTMEQLFRPTLHLAATWLHGFKVLVSIGDEDCKKDAECQIEQLARALSHLLRFTSQLPLNLHVQTDNCFREGKNRYVLNWGLLLVILGVFRSVCYGYLRTAHSHEDVDQVFGQLARYLAGRTIPSAEAMVNFIQNATSRKASAAETSGPSRLHGSDAFTYKLDEVSSWKPWLEQTGIIFSGMRHVHYIRFCKRADLGGDVLDNVQEVEDFKAGSPLDGGDIFLVTKQWLADKQIQRCVAILPAGTATSIRLGCHLPAGIAERRPIGSSVQRNIASRVPKCVQSGELSQEGAAYLQGWSQGTLKRHPKPSRYEILGYRYSRQMASEVLQPGAWQIPRRRKRFDLALDPRLLAEADSDTENEGQVDLPTGAALES